MKLTTFLLFAVVATVAASWQRTSNMKNEYLQTAQPFTSGNTYRFRYDAQISSGLGSMDSSEQKSTHRLSAMVNVNFETDRSASLRLEDIQIASLNGELPELRRVQAFKLFDDEKIDSEKLEELQMPCSFDYSEGTIERLYFDVQDTVWSKNIKRAVMNLIQLNLKERDNQEDVMRSESTEVSSSKMFAVNETTVEGKCEVVYSIAKVSNNDEDRQVFNVTKTIDFKKCSKIPTVYYGRRIETPSVISKRHEIEEQQLDRSTVLRYQLVGTLDKYGIANVELLSQYTVDAEQVHAMQTVVAARLTIDSVERQSRSERSSNTKEESLLYSSEWDLIEKRFYQYGDEEFTSETTPFKNVQNKVTLIVSMIRKVAESTKDKTDGIEIETTLKLQKAVELLRMCDKKEIQQIVSKLERNEDELDVFMDVCAMAGTHNTIHYLVEKIMKEDITSTKAVVLLRQLNGLPAISDKQIDMVLRLCKHNVVEKSEPLQQACWLSLGSMIGDLCKGTIHEHEMCPRHKKQTYEQTLWSQYKSAENQYEKILALKAIGNAANDLAVINLEQVILDRSQSPMIRMHAIDALRRHRNEMPRKIQRILLPIFKNGMDVPEVRMTAFSMIMATFPEKSILDQITYTLHSERSNHVKSFVVRCYNALSTSTIPEEREMAPHLRAALSLANVDLDMTCHYHRIPLYFGERQEGLFLNLASLYSTTDGIPKHLAVSLDSLFTGLYEKDTVSLSFTQENLEDLYHRFMQNWYQMDEPRSNIRAQRSIRSGEQEIDSIFGDLKIKTREAFEQTPFGLINLRIRDIDQIVLPFGEEFMPKMLKTIYNGEKLSAKDLHSLLVNGDSMHFTTSLSFQERSMKIATSSGMPLYLLHSLPVIAAFNGKVKVQISSENVKVTVKAQPLLSGVQTRKMEIWSPLINTGVESLRSIDLNLPIDMDATISHKNTEEKIKVVLRIPEQKTRLVSLHSLPLTFIRQYDAKLGIHGKTTVKTIHNSNMDSRHREIESTETSFTVSGHYYQPSAWALTEFNALTWSSENHIHVDFDRRQECANSLELIISGKLFQNTETTSAKPRFEQFYQDNTKFQPVFDDDVEDDDETETQHDRKSRLSTYLSDEYKPRAAYRHFIKAVVKTIGGEVDHKLSVNVEARCDSHMAFCRINTEVRRTPMLHGEKSDWTLKSEAQFLKPEYVREVSELNDRKSSGHNKLAATLDVEWGCKEMQNVNVRLQGERAVPQQWLQRSTSDQQWRRVLATAFINKYDVDVEYQLTPKMKARLQHYFELVKYWNYWNYDSSDSIEGRKNELKATLIIDPRTRQHFNVSIKTPSERTRLTNLRLPITVKPFPLIRPQEQQRYEINSFDDMITEYSDSRRAECRVDGRRIKTFDSVSYKAPIGRCYSIIAKDCARKSFVVLMKTIDDETEAKNIKIVTAKKTIEVELVREKLVVKVNGERVADKDRLDEHNIDYSEDLVRVMLPEGVSVRFDGKKASVKLSNYYKNAQCGLCGEFNGEQDDEFRMNDNSLTDDVKDFHRSYSMLNDDDDCKDIYNKQNLFGRSASSKSSQRQQYSDDFENEDMDEEVEEYDMFDRRDKSEGRRVESEDENVVQEPIMKTRVIEHNHKICFSLKPVKECARGTMMQNSEDIRIPFTCKDRSSTEARRLLRESKSSDITHKLSQYKQSFVETVRSARICV